MKVKTANLLVCSTLAAAVIGQGAARGEPGLVATFDITQRIEFEREKIGQNSDDRRFSRTDLGFGLTSESPGQELSLFLGAGLEYNIITNESLDLDTLNGRLNYERSNRNSQLGFRLNYREQDVDDAVLEDVLDDDGGFIDFDTGTGQRETLDFRTELNLGTEGPLSADLRYSYRDVSFSDTNDPDLQGDIRNAFNANLGFDLSPTLSLGAIYAWRDLDSKSVTGTDRTTQIYALQADYQPRSSTLLTASLNETDIDTTSDSEDDGGFGYTLGVRQQLKNGFASANFSSTETVNGERRQFSIRRSGEIPRGSFDLSVGVAKTGSLSVEPIINFGLSYQTSPSGSFNVGLVQRVLVNSNDDETIVSRLSVGYSQVINSKSSFDVSLLLANENVLTDVDDDQATYRGGLSYRYDVGNDWDLVTGLELLKTDRNRSDDRTKNTIFVGLNRSFSYRP